MILAGNQPYFFPYLGYWQMINAADVFLICDDYSYIKQGWINRNRILINNSPHFFCIPVSHPSCNKTIREHTIASNPIQFQKLLKTISYAYQKAPYFNEGYSLFESLLLYPNSNLSKYVENSIRQICRYLGIQTEIRNSSEFYIDKYQDKQERFLRYCKMFHATTWINPIGGLSLYNPHEVAAYGVGLKFLKSDLPPYRQFNNDFVPGLSILDAIMFCSKGQLQEMLCCYSLV